MSHPWPRTYIKAASRYGVIEKDVRVGIAGLSLEEVRWLADELVRAAEMLEAEQTDAGTA